MAQRFEELKQTYAQVRARSNSGVGTGAVLSASARADAAV